MSADEVAALEDSDRLDEVVTSLRPESTFTISVKVREKKNQSSPGEYEVACVYLNKEAPRPNRGVPSTAVTTSQQKEAASDKQGTPRPAKTPKGS
jgi:hypothetical protein